MENQRKWIRLLSGGAVFLASALLFFLTVIGSLLTIIGLCGTWLEISENGVTGEAILFLLATVGGGALGTICFLTAKRLPRRTTCPAGAAPQKTTEGPGFELVYEDGHIRPYAPIDTSVPFVVHRAPHEVEEALAIIQREHELFWYVPREKPADLTDEMVAEAERVLGLKLPASYLAILRMQNGGTPYRDEYAPDSMGLPELCGIAPGHASQLPIQELPRYIWEAFEGYVSDEEYQKWWATLDCVHPDWGERPRIPEAVLLVAPEVHWGIGLNYIRCGRQGEPSVVHVEMEHPCPGEVLQECAPDFMTFLRRLRPRRNGEAYGFVDVQNARHLLTCLMRSFGTRFEEDASYLGGQCYRADAWGGAARIWVSSNKCDLPEPYNEFQTNLRFASNPECNWILEVEIREDHRKKLERRLAKIPYNAVPLPIRDRGKPGQIPEQPNG